jgi:hypothetical protein
LATSSFPVPLSPWISAGDRRHLLDLDQHLLDRSAFADNAGALLQLAALDEPPGGCHRIVRRHRLDHDLGGPEPLDPLGALRVGRLEQGQGRDLRVVGQAGQLLRVGLVHRAGQDHQIGVFPAHGAPGVVQAGEHGGGELGGLERRVEPHGGLEVVHGDEDLRSHE